MHRQPSPARRPINAERGDVCPTPEAERGERGREEREGEREGRERRERANKGEGTRPGTVGAKGKKDRQTIGGSTIPVRNTPPRQRGTRCRCV